MSQRTILSKCVAHAYAHRTSSLHLVCNSWVDWMINASLHLPVCQADLIHWCQRSGTSLNIIPFSVRLCIKKPCVCHDAALKLHSINNLKSTSKKMLTKMFTSQHLLSHSASCVSACVLVTSSSQKCGKIRTLSKLGFFFTDLKFQP